MTMRDEISSLKEYQARHFILVQTSPKRYVVCRQSQATDPSRYHVYTVAMDAAKARRVYDQLWNANIENYTEETREAILE